MKNEMSTSDKEDSSSCDLNPCANTMEINCIHIDGGEGNHIGNKHINITRTRNVNIIVHDLESHSNSPEAQIIKDIHKNFKKDMTEVKLVERRICVLFNTLLFGSIIIFALVVTFIFSITSKVDEDGKSDEEEVLNKTSICNSICIVGRDEWGWIPVRDKEYCIPPNATYVRVNLLQKACSNFNQCSHVIKNFQSTIMYTDDGVALVNKTTKSNFIIGGDERVYIGRGWDCSAFIDYLYIDIMFSNYFYTLTRMHIYLVMHIINNGFQCGHIRPGFILALKCGNTCYFYKDFESAIVIAKKDVNYFKNYESFLNYSKLINPNILGNSNTCKTVSSEVLVYNVWQNVTFKMLY